MSKKKSTSRRGSRRRQPPPAARGEGRTELDRSKQPLPRFALSAWWALLALPMLLAVVVVVWTQAGRADGTRAATSGGPEHLTVRVLHTYPHDPEAFTQGLLWHEGHLFESTGQYGASAVRRVALETGEVLQRRANEAMVFGEGLARVRDQLVQLSWMEHEAYVWNLRDFTPVRTFEYAGEGWGLCYDGAQLVMTDGSDRIFFRDPETFAILRTVHVRDRGESVDQLNELECVDGVLWANVWRTDRILRIDPHDGRVTAVVDARGLLTDDERRSADVLNGIAWIPERRHFAITGKLWPHIFEVEFVPAEVR